MKKVKRRVMVNRKGNLNMDQMEANGIMSNVVINNCYAETDYGWDTHKDT